MEGRSHTLLTLEVAATRGFRVIGVVISHTGGELSTADAANLCALREELGSQLVGEVPPLTPDADVPSDAIDFDAIVSAMTNS